MKTPATERDYLKKLHILIVDDMPFMRSFIKNCVEISFPNCICDCVVNGKSAIENLKTQSFSIVLCDWELPDIKGDEILRWIREESEVKDMPFIMITATNDKESISKVVSMGITAYVVKPINCEILTSKIESALRPR